MNSHEQKYKMSFMLERSRKSGIKKYTECDDFIIAQKCLHFQRKKKLGNKGLVTLKAWYEQNLRPRWMKVSWVDNEKDWFSRWMDFPDHGMHFFNILLDPYQYNGEASSHFRLSRGLRQGDLLSLYLFLLCVERSSGLIDQSIS